MDCSTLAQAISTLTYRRLGQLDTCIFQTRLAVAVLRELKVNAYPLSVFAYALNAPAIKLMAEGCYYKGNEAVYAEAGAWSIGLGGHIQEAHPGRWPGHLVAVVERRMMIDGALGNISRPAYNIVLGANAFPVHERFLRARDQIRIIGPHEKFILQYEAIPSDKSFLDAPDWNVGDISDSVKVLAWEVQRSGGLQFPPVKSTRDHHYQEEDATINPETIREIVS